MTEIKEPKPNQNKTKSKGRCLYIMILIIGIVFGIYLEDVFSRPDEQPIPSIPLAPLVLPAFPTSLGIGATASDKDDGFKVEVVASQAYVLRDSNDPFQVLFKVTMPAVQPAKKRNPTELCIVLDDSGSMSGSPIEFAKGAIEEIIKNLHPDDILHLVSYSDSDQVHFTGGTRDQMERLLASVRSIHAGGGTNMYAGLTRASSIFSSSRDFTKRIFLFSDGHVNYGETNPEKIQSLIASFYQQNGITTVSFGIGSGFNEQLMSGIAHNGKGDFFFIETAADIPRLVAKAFDGLSSLIGFDSVLKINEGNGVQVTKAYGYDVPHSIPLGDVRSSEEKKVLFEVTVDTKSSDPMKIFKYELEYRVPKSEATKKIKGEFKMKTTSDKSKIESKDLEVIKFLRLQKIFEQEKEANEMMKRKQFDDGSVDKMVRIFQRNEQVLKNVKESERDEDWEDAMSRTKKQMETIQVQKDYNAASKRAYYYGSMGSYGSSYHRGFS